MPEASTVKKPSGVKSRHRSRFGQIPIYLGKQFRFFVNESDWKVIPMSAIIAALVAIVIRKRFFVDMEGGLMSAFALSCVGIWNGCFNSIQAICRERAVIKREHRSGMHVSSYIIAHMIYQLFLCLVQSAISIYVLKVVGVRFPDRGLVTGNMMLDLGLTLLMISYASDMLSLFISSVSHTTTAAMTVMPFVLIFQLVFSGGVIPLPEWCRPLSNFTISNYGIKAIASQTYYNELPMTTPWNTVKSMRNSEINLEVTPKQVLDTLNGDLFKSYRGMTVVPSFTVEDAVRFLNDADKTVHWREAKMTDALTLGDLADAAGLEQFAEKNKDTKLNDAMTLEQALDFANSSEWVRARQDRPFSFKTTVGAVIDAVGEEKVKEIIVTKAAEASWNEDYESDIYNVLENWIALWFFTMLFALMASVSLKFIDRDRR